ncbi:MAG: phosphate ABC transporter substrate-binding protein PstS [Rhizobiales bacterium 24-66-13]|nr:MAG: phosphate ABC transporter substrate-binding protein PstS [Rhizobiales bacterium 12-66-7]OYX72373.1 MAG: phosphate ABC transporter substrate-binding protein PstS [Rhizobiales bacterium 32-66-11]OYY84521.1 MAG: phosphate ABC transporter substrate-binding protein PstS [Rhizobiales bacterium 35-66-30]OYZ77598.1 MAG: phosphate ABC transporter substrate-binding protein PstS [Rhizobiales bacterium 24-66-13]
MKLTTAFGAAIAVAGSLFVGGAFAADITGAGATFPAPVYQAWAVAYKEKTGTGLNYQSIGSGAGQTQIFNRTVDFGASDAPVDSAKLAQQNLLQFPAVIGSVVTIVNLDGVEANKLKLTGPVLADIYLGKITKWDDKAIADLNPGLKLPSIGIVPTYRSDGSGTTYVFATYLADVSAEWKSKVGAATSVSWPAGAGGKGNEGVAGTVKNTKGAIGYVEYIYASANNLVTTELQNKAGKFVSPTVPAFQAAAANADWANAKDFAASMINTPGDATWPITSATFILLPKQPKSAEQAKDVMKFFDWAFEHGGPIAEKLHYIPLPKDVAERVRAAWKSDVLVDGKPVWSN